MVEPAIPYLHMHEVVESHYCLSLQTIACTYVCTYVCGHGVQYHAPCSLCVCVCYWCIHIHSSTAIYICACRKLRPLALYCWWSLECFSTDLIHYNSHTFILISIRQLDFLQSLMITHRTECWVLLNTWSSPCLRTSSDALSLPDSFAYFCLLLIDPHIHCL